VAAARTLLASVPRGAVDERVAAWPDERTVRYYQSLGLVDRPLRHEGREAIYGYRHLLQAVAVKLLQGEGHSLAQVQRALAGLGTDALEQAVATALGAPVPEPPSPAAEASRALITRELGPGILLTLDPRLVPDPEALLARIARALHSSPSGGTP
jgi:DNA-binding transcriptional MerR regulator